MHIHMLFEKHITLLIRNSSNVAQTFPLCVEFLKISEVVSLSELKIDKSMIYYSYRFAVSGGIKIAVHKHSIQGYGNK